MNARYEVSIHSELPDASIRHAHKTFCAEVVIVTLTAGFSVFSPFPVVFCRGSVQ